VANGRPASPVRATFFYSVLLFLLVQVGGMLQSQLRLYGSMLTHLLILLGVPLFFALYLDRRRLAEVFRLRRLTLVGAAKSLLLGLIGWALAYVIGVVLFSLVTRAGGKLPQVYQELTAAPFLLALLVGAIVPSVCEEMAFRGYLLHNLGPLGAPTAAAVTAVLFGAMHLSLVRVLPLIVLGLLFAAGVQRTGSILTGMIMHFVNNAMALGLTYYYRPEGAAPTESPELTAGTLLITLLMGAGLAAAAGIVLRTLGPGDVVADPSAVDVADEDPSEPREGLGHALVPLIPAILIYAWAAGTEVVRVFASR